MNKKLIIASSLTLALAPAFTLAATSNILPMPGVGPTDIYAIINTIFGIVWPLFAAFAVLMFIYAGFQFLNARGEDTSTARMAVVWGSVGVGVAVLAFSIPFIIRNVVLG